MEIILNALAAITLFVSTVTGTAALSGTEAESVEFGLSEVSPLGEGGGFAMPASGCSSADPSWHGGAVHDCDLLPDISADEPVVRYGEPVVISWDPRSHTNCVLSNNLMVTTPVPDGDVADDRTLILTGESVFTIVCDGVGNSDAVTVKVLPRFQET